jgi:hypothetical protein
MRTLDEVIARSAGARLISYTFESKELRFQLYLETEGKLLAVALPTDTVHGRTVDPSGGRATCRIELFDLCRYVPTLEGRYVPPPDPNLFLDHARDRLSLAYGRRVTDCRHMILLRGKYPLLAFLVRDLSEIRWSVE